MPDILSLPRREGVLERKKRRIRAEDEKQSKNELNERESSAVVNIVVHPLTHPYDPNTLNIRGNLTVFKPKLKRHAGTFSISYGVKLLSGN